MSPQLLWTIAGLILTILTLGGVTISSYQSMDASSAKLVASEIGNVATASKLWLANDTANGTFTTITPTLMTKYIPDLVITANKFDSKAVPGVTIDVAVGASPDLVVISAANVPAATQAALTAALTGKACTLGGTGAAPTYTCKG